MLVAFTIMDIKVLTESIPPTYKQDNTELSSGLYPRNAYWFSIQIAINTITTLTS